jgi:transposase
MKCELTNTPVKKELFIGLDGDKDSITVAVAQGGRDGEVRLYGAISNDLHVIEKVLTRLRKAHGANPRIEIC